VNTALLIAVKDLRRGARDRSVLILAFVAPLALGFIFGIILGGIDDLGERVTFDYGVVDLDGGDLADGFRDLLADLEAAGLVELETYDDVDTARSAVDDDEVAAVFVLPDGLSAAYATGTEVTIQVIGSVDSPIATDVATSIARGFATRSGTAALAGLAAADVGAIEPAEIGSVAAEVGGDDPLAVTEALETEGGRLDFRTTMIAGMAIFFAFFTAGTAVTGILEEREAGTLPRLLISPASRASILVGKVMASITIGVVALIALMLTSTVVMGADWGPIAGVLPLIVVGVLAATGIMALVGGLAKNAEQAGNLQSIVAVSMAMLGGAFGMVAPDEDSLWGQIALLTPVRWFLRGLEDMAAGGVAEVVPSVVVLGIMAVLTGTVAVLLAGKALLRP
jgi:ABC-2 type transport system permease protein